jgi:nucleoside-diphosphate-sugar epimerase
LKASILLTGSTGFVGRALADRLLSEGHILRGATRGNGLGRLPFGAVDVGVIDGQTAWHDALAGVDCVVHLAARTHVVREVGGGTLADYRPVNVEGTRWLAESAAKFGVTRMVLVSSIKVNGNRTVARPFTYDDRPNPTDAYGVTKWEAEKVLAEVSSRTGLETVVVRPPLVYGPGVKANFKRLVRGVRVGVPLPLGAIRNRRSLIGIDNLVDLLARCVHHPSAAGQTFLASDGEDLSTPALIRRIARAMGKSSRLFPVPPQILRVAGRMIGKRSELDRLIGSLQVDIRHTRDTLDWTPPIGVDEGLRRCVLDS